MQQTLIAGDTLAFTTTLTDYPASAGWALTYRLTPRTSGAAYTLTATPDVDDYDVDASATVTALWTAGEYSWAAYVTKAGERYTVESGTITILPDPGVVGAYDGRSHARKALAQVEAAIEALSLGVKEYSIAGRSMTHRDLPELLEMRSRYSAEVQREDAAGRPEKRRYLLRFGRA